MSGRSLALVILACAAVLLGSGCLAGGAAWSDADSGFGGQASSPATVDLEQLSIMELAEEVGARNEVPADLLLALGWVSSSLSPAAEGHGECTPGSSWMGLNSEQVARASSLTGLSPEEIAHQREASFLAAAALLAANREQLSPHADGTADARWWPVLERWSALGEAWLEQELAMSVFTVLQRGLVAQSADGEAVFISARSLPGLADVELEEVPGAIGARDGALHGYPGSARYVPAHSSNYSNRPAGLSSIDTVVIHTTEGSYEGAISWFRNPSAEVSAHYVIRKSDGHITQMVSDHRRAWHAASANDRAIGIEHEGAAANPSTWTGAMLDSSARLSAWLSERYSIPIDRNHFIAHSEVDGSYRSDPGPHFPWADYLDRVKCYRFGGSYCDGDENFDSSGADESGAESSSGGTDAAEETPAESPSDASSDGAATEGAGSGVDAPNTGLDSAPAVRIVAPQDGAELTTTVALRAERSGGPWVEFWAGAFRLGNPTTANPAHADVEFFLTGERSIRARLYSNSGVLLAEDVVRVRVRRPQGEMVVQPSRITSYRWRFDVDVSDLEGEVNYVTYSLNGEDLQDSETGADHAFAADFSMLHQFHSDPIGALLLARAWDAEGGLLASDSVVLSSHHETEAECALVGSLSCGDRVFGDTALAPEASNLLDAYPELPGNFSGPELGYRLVLGPASEVEISLLDPRPFELNHDLLLLDASSNSCLASGFVQRGFNTLQFEPQAGRSYVLVVDGYGGDAGPFGLEISCS